MKESRVQGCCDDCLPRRPHPNITPPRALLTGDGHQGLLPCLVGGERSLSHCPCHPHLTRPGSRSQTTVAPWHAWDVLKRMSKRVRTARHGAPLTPQSKRNIMRCDRESGGALALPALEHSGRRRVWSDAASLHGRTHPSCDGATRVCPVERLHHGAAGLGHALEQRLQ